MAEMNRTQQAWVIRLGFVAGLVGALVVVRSCPALAATADVAIPGDWAEEEVADTAAPAPPESVPAPAVVTTTTTTTTTEVPGPAVPAQRIRLPTDEGWLIWLIGEVVAAFREGRWTEVSGLLLSLCAGLFFFGKRAWTGKGRAVPWVYRRWDALHPLAKAWIFSGVAVLLSVLTNVVLAGAPTDVVIDNGIKAAAAASLSWNNGLKYLLDPDRPLVAKAAPNR